MTRISVLLCLMFNAMLSYSQEIQGQNMKVETMDAYYPGGDKALTDYISSNIQFSEAAKASKLQGEIILSFSVEPDSTLANIKVFAEPGHGCGEQVKQIMTNVRYIPAFINNIPIRSKVIVTIPVRAY